MLYHSCQISLGLPWLIPKYITLNSLSMNTTSALSLCTSSIDTIISILRRCKTQHPLKCAPFVFIHGTILAAEALITTSNFQCPERPLLEDAQLRVLDGALLEMASAWKVAERAREGLHNLVSLQTTESPSSTIPSDLHSSPTGAGNLGQDMYKPTSVESGFDWQALTMNTSHTFEFGPIGMADPYLWNPNLLNADLSKLQGQGFVNTEFEAGLNVNYYYEA